jgi:hypothetical protein
MKQNFQILIPNPCSENWDKMNPNKIGRHCSVCNKTVVDFTKMSDNEIKQYFLVNASKKTCGHFYKGQLNLDKNKVQKYFTDQYYKAYFGIKYKFPRIVTLLVLSFMLTIVGCNTPTQGELIEKTERVTGDSISTNILDSIKVDTIKNGL